MSFADLVKLFTLDDAESAGYDAAINGPASWNCHFRYFATPELTRAWERGNVKGKADKP